MKGTSIKDSIHGLIQLSGFERKIISTPGFNRLHDVYQNSTLYLTFPCNRTKRYEHSIGTMKICSDMFFQSILNTEENDLKEFYDCAANHINDIIDQINAQESGFDGDIYLCGKTNFDIDYLSKELVMDECRRSFVPNGVPSEFFTIQVILMEALRTAALLHDVGHPPFSHIVEFALQNVYEFIDRKRNDAPLTLREKEFLEALDPCFKGDGTKHRKLHEHMGDMITDNILRMMVKPITKKPYEIKEELAENLFAIIVYHVVFGIYHDESFFSALHGLIDGEIDGDRLDYLTRDPENSGVDVGRIDYNRIISGMRLCLIGTDEKKRKDDCFLFCFPTKAIHSVEDIFRRRYNLYSDIVYHHHVTKTDFLLRSSVETLICDYLSEEKESTKPEVPELLPFDISGLWYPLKPSQKRGKEMMKNNLVQWNDSWLMTLLKQIYYRDYESFAMNGDDFHDDEKKLYKQLSELLVNTKHYISLIKRGNNFKILDNEIKVRLRSRQDVICQLMDKAQRAKGDDLLLINAIMMLNKLAFDCLEINNSNSFVAQLLAVQYGVIHRGGEARFYDILERAVESSLREIYGCVEDFIIAPVNISVGVNDKSSVFFYDAGEKREKRFLRLDDVSDIVDILNFELEHFPPFYLYVSLDKPEENNPELEEAALREIGARVARDVFQDIKAYLSCASMKHGGARTVS